MKNLDEKFDHLQTLSKMIKVNSCEALAKNGIHTNGYYDVNLGNSRNPVNIHCDFEQKETRLGEEITSVVEHCATDKCLNKTLPYQASYDQLRNLIESSPSCYQNLSFQCLTSPLQVSTYLSDNVALDFYFYHPITWNCFKLKNRMQLFYLI